MRKYNEKNSGDFGFVSSVFVKCMPGRSPSWNLCAYSKYLMTKKQPAKRNVSTRKNIARSRLPLWVDVTANSIVTELVISTTVFVAPIGIWSILCASWNISG